jgi:uncharacterized membrane protein YhaH (DUF805 family)
MERSFRFWWWWLVVLAAAALLVGLVPVLFAEASQRLFGGFLYSDPGAIAGFGVEAARLVRFVTAVLGAVMAGWAAAILAVLFGPFRARRPEAWWLIAIPLVVWFVPDTAYSLSSGFWPNAALNAVAFVMFAIPLAATFSAFGKPSG